MYGVSDYFGHIIRDISNVIIDYDIGGYSALHTGPWDVVEGSVYDTSGRQERAEFTFCLFDFCDFSLWVFYHCYSLQYMFSVSNCSNDRRRARYCAFLRAMKRLAACWRRRRLARDPRGMFGHSPFYMFGNIGLFLDLCLYYLPVWFPFSFQLLRGCFPILYYGGFGI